LSLFTSSVVEKRKSRKERLRVFTFFFSIFNHSKHKDVALKKFYKNCLTLAETLWKIDPLPLLVSYWLEAFSRGFFFFTQPGKHLGIEWEITPMGLHFFGVFSQISTTLPTRTPQYSSLGFSLRVLIPIRCWIPSMFYNYTVDVFGFSIALFTLF
jgi:hypothetical protein